jgi:anaerobic dimethyl sulfoxide reductase subunit B
MQLGFYFDQTRCIGCHACEVACKDWHDVPAGPVRYLKVTEIVQGEFPAPFAAYIFRPCYHCADPACIEACPIEAISKRATDGIVIVDRESCLGEASCGLCKDACPYDATQFGDENNATLQKCNFCVDRWQENKKPVCVEGCPARALDAGPIGAMNEKYGLVREAPGFAYSSQVKPSVIFKKRPRHF